MPEDFQIEFKKEFSRYHQMRTIKECFYHKKDECHGKIKHAHSLQRNKRLSILEEEIDGNSMLYTFTEFEIGKDVFIKKLVPIGKGKASAFFGFCDFHDTHLFSEIENKEYVDSDHHCFLHSYRSFAHSYHRKNEEKKGNSNINPINKGYSDEFNSSLLYGNTLAVDDLNYYKQFLDKWIENKEYDRLDYLTVILPELYPIACSSLISPFFSIKGHSINNHDNPDIPWSPIMLTVLPDFTQTIIILASFPDDKNGLLFLDELGELNDYHFKRAISTLLIYFAENTFMSPSLWQKLGRKRQNLLCRELEKGISLGMTEIPKKFEFSSLNLFENQYKY